MKADGTPLSEKPVKPNEEIYFSFKLNSSENINDVVLGVSLSRTQGGDIWGIIIFLPGIRLTLAPGLRSLNIKLSYLSILVIISFIAV
jgi:lipopolysaccharide transport system ATP-binding protein